MLSMSIEAHAASAADELMTRTAELRPLAVFFTVEYIIAEAYRSQPACADTSRFVTVEVDRLLMTRFLIAAVLVSSAVIPNPRARADDAGSVVISGAPAGARVVIDGTPIAELVAPIALPAGPHRVEVRTP